MSKEERLRRYMDFHDQKFKKALNKKKYTISPKDKLILGKLLELIQKNPTLALAKKDDINKIIIGILKRSKK